MRNNNFKKIAIITIAIFLLLMNIPPNPFWNDENEIESVQAAPPSRPTGSSGSYTVDVVADPVPARPAVYWTQLDNLSFEAIKDGGKVPSANSGSDTPLEQVVSNTVDLSEYNLPASFRGNNNINYERAALTDMFLESAPRTDKKLGTVSVTFKDDEDSYKGVSLTPVSKTKYLFTTKTGSPNPFTDRVRYGTTHKGEPKHTVRYDTPVYATWYGKVEMKAEVRVVEDSSMAIGQKKNFKLQLRTKTGAYDWTSWNDTAAATWSSDKSSVASVSSSGQVTANAVGQAKISATWIKDNYHLVASANVEVKGQDAIGITGKLNACLVDGSTKLQATMYQSNGGQLDLNSITATKWLSSDATIATVSKGMVTFVKAGTVDITVDYLGKTEKVTVTIMDCTTPPPPDPSNSFPPNFIYTKCLC